MLPNINFYSGNTLLSSQIKNAASKTESQNESIEAKLNAQSAELLQRAKVIEELKTSLSIFIDKYNKLKVELERERQHGIQISIGLKAKQSLSKKSLGKFNFKITQSSLYFPRSIVLKSAKIKSEKEIKSLKEKLEKLKNEKSTNENELNNSLSRLKGELDDFKSKFNSCKNELENEKNESVNKDKLINEYNSSIVKLKNDIENEKIKYQNDFSEFSNLNNKISSINDEKEALIKNINSYKNEIIILKNNEDLYKKKIKDQKEEIDRLKNDMVINFKKAQDENDDLLEQINLLNNKLQSLNINKSQQNIPKQNNQFTNIKILNCCQFSFSSKGKKVDKNDEKVNQLNIIINNLKEDNNTINKKYKDLNIENNKLIKILKEKDKNNINNLNQIKDYIAKMYEGYNVYILKIEKDVVQKMDKLKKTIHSIKSNLKKLKAKINNNIDEESIKSMKDFISELQGDKNKLLTKMSNYEKIYKEKDKKMKYYEKALKEKENIIQNLQNQLSNKQDSSELESINKELCKKLEMYIRENKGQSKALEERNQEIKELKKLIKN